jgi:hypothetical protein
VKPVNCENREEEFFGAPLSISSRSQEPTTSDGYLLLWLEIIESRFNFRNVLYDDPRRHYSKTFLVYFKWRYTPGFFEINQYAISFVFEHLEELWDIRFINAQIFAVMFEDRLNSV